MKTYRKKTVKKVANLKCSFCEQKKKPDYKDYEYLEKFITDRKKIIGSALSGVCARHQKDLAVEIKRARHLALLPFVEKIS